MYTVSQITVILFYTLWELQMKNSTKDLEHAMHILHIYYVRSSQHLLLNLQITIKHNNYDDYYYYYFYVHVSLFDTC